MSDEPNMTSETLAGDARDTILNYIRNFPKSWAELSEDQQRTAVLAIQQFAQELVGDCVTIIKSEGRETLHGQILNWTVKGSKVKITLEASATDDVVVMLNHCRSGDVQVISADKNRHMGERKPAEGMVMKDQGSLLDVHEDGVTVQEEPAVAQDDPTQDPEAPPANDGVVGENPMTAEQTMPADDFDQSENDPRPFFPGEMNALQLKNFSKAKEQYFEGTSAYLEWDGQTDPPANPYDGRAVTGKMWQLGWGHACKKVALTAAAGEPLDPTPSEGDVPTAADQMAGQPSIEESQGGWQGAAAEVAATPPPVPSTADDVAEPTTFGDDLGEVTTYVDDDPESAEVEQAEAEAEAAADPTPPAETAEDADLAAL